MSIDFSGLTAKSYAADILISISENASLLALTNLIDWQRLSELALPDLKNTPSGQWWRGRKIALRIHLGILVLQAQFNETDRGIEKRLQSDALWQMFCGRQVVEKWHIPDHTRIEDFRSRLSPATHHEIGILVIKWAQEAGFAKGQWMDIDSSVQEANISYPTDASLMLKLARKAKSLLELGLPALAGLSAEVGKVAIQAKAYFFAGKQKSAEYKQNLFEALHKETTEQVLPVIKRCLEVPESTVRALSTRTRGLFEQVCHTGGALLAGIKSFIETRVVDKLKPLSLHAKAVVCINKGKLGKPFEFGRVFQMGRVEGNFLIIAKAKDLRESDKSSAGRLVHTHRKVFGAGVLKDVGADRGYHSKKNVSALKHMGVKDISIQRPSKCSPLFAEMGKEEQVLHYNRRAGIEPLIGHAKNGGLRRSRMKTDKTTEASAYRSVMGFNLRQLVGHLRAARVA